jgi:hypothetical protein
VDDDVEAGAADPGATPTGPDAPELERDIDDLRIAFDLDDCCLSEFRQLVDHYLAYVAARSAERAELATTWDAHRLHHAAEHGNALPAFASFLRTTSGDALDIVDPFTDALSTHSDLGAVADYLRAQSALIAARPHDALAAIERAVAADPELHPALDLQAVLLADAGRAVEGLAVRKRLNTMGVPRADTDALLSILHQDKAVGRNDPCPCGSGRKYKQCCLREPQLGTADRRRLALHQGVRYAVGPEHGRTTLYSLAITATTAASASGRERAELFARIAADPFLVDLVVHESGGLARYLVERGDLVPADERAWLDTLAATPLGLWSQEPDGDGTYRLTNATDGAVLDRIRFPGGGHPEPGSELLGRVVADAFDGHPAPIGPVLLVEPRHHDDVVALIAGGPDAERWAGWFGALLAASPRG